MTWDDKTILELRRFLRQHGGDIDLPVRRTRDGGFDAQFRVPDDAPPGWGQQMLQEFEKQHR